jgi:hypothetical protein
MQQYFKSIDLMLNTTGDEVRELHHCAGKI